MNKTFQKFYFSTYLIYSLTLLTVYLKEYIIQQTIKTMFHHLNTQEQTMESQNQLQDYHTNQHTQYNNLPSELIYYLKKLHSQDQNHNILINLFYRSHLFHILQGFDSIKLTNMNQIQQPPISYFFKNQYFMDLKKIVTKEDQQIMSLPGPFIQPLPNDLKKILDKLYNQYGYIPNFERTLLFFPSYLSKHYKLCQQLFQIHNNQPIVYFLAICAAAELGCLYFVNRFIKKFLQSGGQTDWLRFKVYPKKVGILIQLNRKLARSVWQINSQLIQFILNQGGFLLSQLIFLTFSICYVHQMSTIALSMGLQEEEKDQKFFDMKSIKQILRDYQQKTIQTQHKQDLSKVFSYLISDRTVKDCIKTRKAIKRQERRHENQTYIEGYMKQIAKGLNNQQLYIEIHKCFQNILPPFQILEKRQQQINPPIDESDYSFQLNAYPALKNIAEDAADLFFNLLQYSQSMTKFNFGSEKCLNGAGTKAFRKAITYYSQNLCGFTHLDYDYKSNYKKYLTLPLKFQIRLMTFSPLHITKQVITEVSQQPESEMFAFDNAHVAVLIANSKMKMALMTVVRAAEQ